MVISSASSAAMRPLLLLPVRAPQMPWHRLLAWLQRSGSCVFTLSRPATKLWNWILASLSQSIMCQPTLFHQACVSWSLIWPNGWSEATLRTSARKPCTIMLQFWEHTTLERPGPGSDTITQNEVFRASFKSLRLTQSPPCLLEGDLCSFLLFPCFGFLKT